MEAFEKQLSLLLLVFTYLPFFLLPAPSLAQGEDCSPFPYECGGVKFNISYPFWIDGYPRHSSYPGKEFEIAYNLTDASSEIEIQSQKYHVKKIDYESRTLTVIDKDFFGLDDNSCHLSSFKNTTLDLKFFNYTEGDLQLTFLHNCPLNFEDYVQGVRDCLSNKTGNHAYFTLDSEITDTFVDCQVVKIPILKEYRNQLEKDPHAQVAWKDALGNGFQIAWYAIDPQNKCGNCVQSKGRCGYNESSPLQPICYLSPDHSYNAFEGDDKGKHIAIKGAVKSKRNKLISGQVACMIC